MRAVLLSTVILAVGCDVRAHGRGGKKDRDDAELLGILVTPESVLLPLGSSVQLTATGLFDDRRSDDVTFRAGWVSSDPGVASVGDGLDEEGWVTAHALGTTEVWARMDGVASPKVTVTVTDQALDGLTIEPASLSLALGQQIDLLATARFSDGSRSDATAQVRWIVDDPSVAVLDGARLEAVSLGETTVRAQWDAVSSNPVPVTVSGAVLPDLVVDRIQTWASGSTITVSVDVRNQGTGGASSFWVDLFLDPVGTPRPGDIGDGYKGLGYLGPGEVGTVVFTAPGMSTGAHTVHVLLDTEGAIAESNESNNAGVTSVVVDGSSLPADLVVDAFTYVADAGSVYYWISVSNYGDLPTGSFYVDLYLDEVFAPEPGQDGDVYVDVASIGPWETLAFEYTHLGRCDGCWSWVQADSYDEIPESYEDDNVAGPLVIRH